VIARPFTDLDVAELHAAIQESREHLRPWLPWWNTHETPDDTRDFVRRSQAHWLLRESLGMGLFSREGGALLGGIGLHPGDWTVPSFEIGYWLRAGAEGHGYMSEAVRLLTRYAFEGLAAERVIIRCDARNVRSRSVPERLGYVQEGHMRCTHRDTAGELADMLTYALIREDYERVRHTWPVE
jgi:RimJ/RimL family protein N-acetyltransferase